MIFNLPNLVSFIRVILSPVFFYFLVWGESDDIILALAIYIIASLSDFFDGWLARRYHEVSKIGKFLDPLADKVLTTAAFLAFVFLDIIELWMVVIIIIRDFGTTFLRLYAESSNFTMRTSWTAKWKTFLQMIFITYILILLLLQSENNMLIQYFGLNVDFVKQLLTSSANYYIMLALVIMSLWTLFEYVYDNKSRLFNK